MSVFHENSAIKCIFWPISVQKARLKAIADQDQASSVKESEQVHETVDDYLHWFFNRSFYDPADKMDELDESIEKDCSW